MNMRTLLDKLLGSADWGIHPDDHKRPGADAPVRVMPAPSRLYLPLSQHSGAPARPIVLVGQKVKKANVWPKPRAWCPRRCTRRPPARCWRWLM